MWRVVIAVLIGCSDHTSVEQAPVAPPAPAPVAPPKPVAPVTPSHARMHATWTEIRSSGGCWYFSGPAGRDARLWGDAVFDRDGERVTMNFGGAVFAGTYRDRVLELDRTSTHVFDKTWTVTETIRGEYLAGTVTAHYHYEECERGTRCPNECTIEATLAFSI
jgi:hypothetical protein